MPVGLENENMPLSAASWAMSLLVSDLQNTPTICRWMRCSSQYGSSAAPNSVWSNNRWILVHIFCYLWVFLLFLWQCHVEHLPLQFCPVTVETMCAYRSIPLWNCEDRWTDIIMSQCVQCYTVHYFVWWNPRSQSAKVSPWDAQTACNYFICQRLK